MSANDRKLKPRQDRAIAALLTEPSVKAAARAVGVGESSLRRWLSDPTFREALMAARVRALGATMVMLQGLGETAVATLREVMGDKTAHPGSRVKAALGAIALIVKIETEGSISLPTLNLVSEQMGVDVMEAIRETSLSQDEIEKFLGSIEERWNSISIHGRRHATKG
jgi:hypothetical protein